MKQSIIITTYIISIREGPECKTGMKSFQFTNLNLRSFENNAFRYDTTYYSISVEGVTDMVSASKREVSSIKDYKLLNT